MSRQANFDFIQWVDAIEEELGWTDNKWATKAGISASVLSRARQGITPKWEACMALAEAANRSPITAFRKAGLLPPGPTNEIRLKDWEYLISQLSPDDEAELRQIAEMKINKRQKDKALKQLKTKKT